MMLGDTMTNCGLMGGYFGNGEMYLLFIVFLTLLNYYVILNYLIHLKDNLRQ